MRFIISVLLVFPVLLFGTVQVGADRLFEKGQIQLLKGKRVGLITNHTAVNSNMNTTRELLKLNAKRGRYQIVALFAPEHGLTGAVHAGEKFNDLEEDGTPIYSLHGNTRRPTKEMLKGIDTLIFDIQDIGSRSYTYTSTLLYAMEEAAKYGIEVIVLDRPNPINGTTVDGPMLEEKWRSFVGYINVPYCHGMTVGELARYFNGVYNIDCNLTVIPMKGWKRWMTFKDTHLPWVPTSPHIPEADTPLYYPTTGILGELQIVNIGVGYTLPFKLVGAPWIDSQTFASKLNEQAFPGVRFYPFTYRPFYGKYTKEECHGVLIAITDTTTFKPVSTQYLLIGTLKSLYPQQFSEALAKSADRQEMFHKVNGTDAVFNILTKEKFVTWKLKELHEKERTLFLTKRTPYLIPSYL